jgi:lectin, mannose-binding 2
MLFTKKWSSLCLLAGSLVGVNAVGLEEHPDIKAIPVSLLKVEIMTGC